MGIWYASQVSEALVRAITRLNAVAGTKGVLLEVAGRVASECMPVLRSLGAAFAFRGYITHAEAMTMMSQSDAILVIVNRGINSKGILPGKVFECLASGRPIMCLTPGPCECSDLVTRLDAGIHAHIDSEEEIYSCLRRLYDAWESGAAMSGARREHLHQFDRRELTRRLAALLDAALYHRQS